MNRNPFKPFIYVTIIFFATLPGMANSFAQTASSAEEEDNSSDIEARENKTMEALDQVQNLELNKKNTPDRMNVLKNATNQLDQVTDDSVTAAAEIADANSADDNTSTQGVASHQQPSSFQERIPVQIKTTTAETSPEKHSPAEIKTQELDVSPQPPSYHTPASIFNKVNQFEIASEFSYLEYREEPGLMREKGPYFGIYGAMYSRPEELQTSAINVIHLDTHLSYGLVDYKGSGEINGINDYMVEPRAWLGRDIMLAPSVQLTPYAGIGYRYLYDTLSKGSGGYDRRSQYLYMPVGFETHFQMPDDWQIGFNAEYDIFIRGWQTSYLGDANSLYPTLHNSQRNGFGLRGSLDFIKKMDRVNFLISPYIRYWHIKKSEIATASNDFYEFAGLEPDNNSTEIGLKLGVDF